VGEHARHHRGEPDREEKHRPARLLLLLLEAAVGEVELGLAARRREPTDLPAIHADGQRLHVLREVGIAHDHVVEEVEDDGGRWLRVVGERVARRQSRGGGDEPGVAAQRIGPHHLVELRPERAIAPKELPGAAFLVGIGEHAREAREALLLALLHVALESRHECRAHAHAHGNRRDDVREEDREEELGGDAERHWRAGGGKFPYFAVSRTAGGVLQNLFTIRRRFPHAA